MPDTGSFAIRYDSFDAPHKYVSHFHNAHELILVRDGEAEFIIAGKKYAVKKNSVIFINSFESHKSVITKYPYARYFILADQKFLDASINDPMLLSVFRQRPSLFNHVLFLSDSDSEKISMYFKLIHEANSEQGNYYNDIVKSVFNLMIIDFHRIDPGYFPGFTAGENYRMITEIENHIDSNFKEQISLSETAKLFNCDMYYLSHLFKKITGYGFKEYLINRRLSKAKELLIKTNMNISDICFHSGFKNVNHFIRIFKEKEDITPLKFRKRYE